MTGRSTPEAKPNSVKQSLEAIERRHALIAGSMVSGKTPSAILKAMKLEYVKQHGPEALQPRRRQPMPPAVIRFLLRLDKHVPTALVAGYLIAYFPIFWSNLRGMMAFCAETGTIKAEVSFTSQDMEFDLTRLTRANLRFSIAALSRLGPIDDPDPVQVALITDGDYIVVRPPPSKADRFGERWGNHPIYLEYSRSADVSAAREIVNMETVLPCRGALRRKRPLFVLNAYYQHFHHSLLDRALRDMLSLVPPSLITLKQCQELSWHSFRVTLASSLKAASTDKNPISDSDIQALCRWATPEALRIYARWTPEDYMAKLRKAKAVLHLRSVGLPRLDDAVLYEAAQEEAGDR
jgi:hypothetical protein